MGLERIVDKLNVDQKSGIFSVPPVVEGDTGVRRWLNRLPFPVPVVVMEEVYFRKGVEVKLGSSKRIVSDKLAKYGVIRPGSSEDFSYEVEAVPEPVSNLSLAQAISWAYSVPIESVYVSERDFQKKSFLSRSPEERIKFLFNAYLGCAWFESFRRRQNAISERAGLPIVRKWKRVSRCDLEDWFLIERHRTLEKLCDKGFIIPLNGKSFRPKSLNNLVDPVGLAQLVALLYTVSIDDVLVRDDRDAYLEELATAFINKRLLPYMKSKGMAIDSNYSIAEAAHLTEMRYQRLYQAVKKGSVPNTVFESADTRIRGVNLAIFALKHTEKYSFTHSEVNDLFGLDEVDFLRLGIKTSKRRTHSRHHYVFPVYNLVTRIAREKIIEDKQPVPVQVNDRTFYVSNSAQTNYCRAYGLPIFDEDCVEHLKSQIEKAGLIGKSGKIGTDQLILSVEEDTIKSVRLKTTE